MKRVFSYNKVRNRDLQKNRQQLATWLGLFNFGVALPLKTACSQWRGYAPN